MILLAVETSGAAASVALARDGTVCRERVLSSTGQRHAQALVQDVRDLLRDAEVQAAEVDVVAVSLGPGSFTGLRVGIVFAKTFAWINHARLVAVDTLEAIAHRAPAEFPLVTATIDAQRSEVFAADFLYDADAGCRRRISETRIIPVAQLCTDGVLTGPAVDRYCDLLPPELTPVAAELRNPNAAAVAEIAAESARQNAWNDPDTLEPTYIRRSYAEEKRDC